MTNCTRDTEICKLLTHSNYHASFSIKYVDQSVNKCLAGTKLDLVSKQEFYCSIYLP